MQMIGTRIKGDSGSRLLDHFLAEASAIVSRDRDRWRYFFFLPCSPQRADDAELGAVSQDHLTDKVLCPA